MPLLPILPLLLALPATAASGARWEHLWVGAHTTCAQTTDGTTWCWGDGRYAKLGPLDGAPACGDDPCWPTPHHVAAFDHASAIAIGWFDACAIGADGHVACAGADHRGALGDGPGSAAVCSMGGGVQADCSLDLASGEVRCAGAKAVPTSGIACSPTPLPFLDAAASAVRVPGSAVCAQTEGGWWCSGVMPEAIAALPEQCGTYRDPCTTRPLAVGAWKDLGFAETNRWCTLAGSGALECGGRWGKVALGGMAALATGDEGACALSTEGDVSCWGAGYEGALGRESPRTPEEYGDGVAFQEATRARAAEKVAGLPPIAAISADRSTVCALDRDGGLWCWGRNRFGQVGTGDTTDRFAPARVAGLPPVTGMAVGSEHACALDRDGGLWCWGSARSGELGVPGPDRCDVDYVTAATKRAPCATHPQRVPVPAHP